METLTANQAKTQFGDMLLKVQRAPVQISRNGKPVAVLLSVEDYQALEAIKLLSGMPIRSELRLFDARSSQWRSLALQRAAHCPVCGGTHAHSI